MSACLYGGRNSNRAIIANVSAYFNASATIIDASSTNALAYLDSNFGRKRKFANISPPFRRRASS